MLESEFETNGLTMKLLGLTRYCEGSRAAEIQAVIAKLPIAAYNERSAAEDEVSIRVLSTSSFIEARGTHKGGLSLILQSDRASAP